VIKISNKKTDKNESFGEVFTRVPNSFIRGHSKDIKKRTILVYIYLDTYRNLNNIVNFSLYHLIRSCGYVSNEKTISINNDFKSILEFLYDNQMIEFLTSFVDIKGNSLSQIKLLDNFDCVDNFTKITLNETDTLMSKSQNIDKTILFSIYLYMKSFMINRPLTSDGEEYKNAYERPSSFFGTYNSLINSLGYSKSTIKKCFQEFENIGLLKKYETGSYFVTFNGVSKKINAPNIYVLNNDKSDQEIEWTLDKLKQLYNVDKFYKIQNKKG